jgi:hypothetical protein
MGVAIGGTAIAAKSRGSSHICSWVSALEFGNFKRTLKRVSKSAGAAGGAKADEPLSWPSEISCALCHTAIRPADGIVIAGNRGTLCTDCVKAVAVTRPRETDSN